jgi:glycosyltransferase involved in cell wall biosynthesis
MVTRDRTRLARRALDCLAAQTVDDLELVVVDDGDEDYGPLLAHYRDRMRVEYVRLAPDPLRRLGGLRNIALDAATGAYCVQWDDDEWYHPDRIAVQLREIERHDALGVILDWTLMHVDRPDLAHLAFRGACWGGTPGTILHRRTSVRYPDLPRAEDTKFLRALRRSGRVWRLGREWSHLFVRCFHGTNTWQQTHFLERLRRTPLDWVHYLRARWANDITLHPAFVLEPREHRALAGLLADSQRLRLLATRPGHRSDTVAEAGNAGPVPRGRRASERTT